MPTVEVNAFLFWNGNLERLLIGELWWLKVWRWVKYYFPVLFPLFTLTVFFQIAWRSDGKKEFLIPLLKSFLFFPLGNKADVFF